MRKDKYEMMDEEDLEKLNRVIVPEFGVRSRIVSGSFHVLKGKKLQCNIAVGETNTHKSAIELQRIGEKVKAITEAHEVYSFGVKIA